MNRNGNETESFAGNFVASDEQGLFFEVPISNSDAGTTAGTAGTDIANQRDIEDKSNA
jgi:hypothetical protein